MSDAQTITLLLRELAHGEKPAFDRLIPLVYSELRRIGEARLRGERPGHTLQPTALIHQVYARMVRQEQLGFYNRVHFLGVAAHTMRKILIDHARIRHAAKRDWGRSVSPSTRRGRSALQHPSVIIALDDALNSLEQQDPLMARLIELRYFGELTLEESSVAVNLQVSDVRRELKLAEAWLRRELDTVSAVQGKSSSSA